MQGDVRSAICHDWSLVRVWSGIFCASLLGVALSIFMNPHGREVLRPQEEKVAGEASKAGMAVVSVEEAQKIIGEGGWLVFDARLEREYDAGHLPGALSFPYAQRDEAFKEWASILNSGQKVLVYCSGKLCDDGLHLAFFLRDMGIKDVALFVDGLDGWKKAGLAVE